MTTYQYDFFISRNGQDAQWAEWIAWYFKEREWAPYLQDWDFLPGQNFVERMQEGATNAERTISLLSPDYLREDHAEFSKTEWMQRFAEDPLGKKQKLILIKVRECEPTGFLKQIIYIDLVGKTEAEAEKELDRLLKSLENGTLVPEKKPGFPGSAVNTSKSATAKVSFPGPKISNLPQRLIRHFVSREEILTNLRESFLAGKATVLCQSQTLYGMGGLGKSTAAYLYARKYYSQYDLVWWLNAEQESGLADSYLRLAEQLGISASEISSEVIKQVQDRLSSTSEKWLLIFDNATSSQEIKDYLPVSPNGHLLMTSRNPHWSQIAEPLKLPLFSPTESVEYLLQTTGLKDTASAEGVAADLERLPLALAQAAAYIQENQIDFQAYRQRLKDEAEHLLGKTGLLDYSLSVIASLTLSLEGLKKQSAEAIQFLNLCSFLAPENMPLSIFREGREELSRSLSETFQSPVKIDELLTLLRKHSLIESTGDFLSMHRLTQSVIRWSLAEAEQTESMLLLLKLVQKEFSFKKEDLSTWKSARSLSVHIHAVW